MIDIGSAVEIVVSEPWDVVTALGSARLSGHVVNASGAAIVVRLNRAITLPQGKYEFLLACPRHVGDVFREDHGKLFCNLDSMTDSQAPLGLPADLPSFKGDLGLIGDVAW